MPNANSTYTISITSAGVGQSTGNPQYTVAARDPYDQTFSAFTSSHYNDFPISAEVPSYADQVRISNTSPTSFGCSTSATVSVTPTVFRYDIYTGYANSATACAETTPIDDVYSVVEYSALTTEQSSPTFFTDAALTTAFSGDGSYYKITLNDDEVDFIAVQIDSLGRGGAIATCT